MSNADTLEHHAQSNEWLRLSPAERRRGRRVLDEAERRARLAAVTPVDVGSWRCDHCGLTSGFWREFWNQEDAPSCCGGAPMLPYRIVTERTSDES